MITTDKSRRNNHIILRLGAILLSIAIIIIIAFVKMDRDYQRRINETESLYERLNGQTFVMSSQGGGWYTTITLGTGGTFSGEYYDKDIRVTGEGFPDGVIYESSFVGELSTPRKIDDYTFSVGIKHIEYANEVGSQQLADGSLHVVSDAYGLGGVEELIVYIPGTPIDMIPDEFGRNIGEALLDEDKSSITCYIIYNQQLRLPFMPTSIKEKVHYTINDYGRKM